jgi:hypothetical protein
MTTKTMLRLGTLRMALDLGACISPNDPGKRDVGRGLIGGAAGAGIGALALGSTGSADRVVWRARRSAREPAMSPR